MLRNIFFLMFFFHYGLLCAETLVFPPYGHSYGIRKATPKHLFLFFGPRTFFDNPQGLATTRLTAWDNPKTEKDDDEVVVYGVNSNRHQIIYNTSMWTLGLYGKVGHGNGQFNHPKGITADRHGTVFVADAGNNRIVKLKNVKSTLEWVCAFDGRESGLAFKAPAQVSITENGNVFIADTWNKRIVLCNGTGKVVYTIPCNAPPKALAVADGNARWSFFRNEQTLFFAEGADTLVKTDFKGNVLQKVALPNGYTPSYGAIDYYHNYWVTITNKHVIIKYNHNLQLLDIFGSYGKGDYQFIDPRGIAIYKRYGQVFISEKKGAQYYWIGTDCKSASIAPHAGKEKYTLTVKATEYSFLSLFSLNGKDTLFYMRKQKIPPGNAVLNIDSKGEDLMNKEVVLNIEPTYSSYSYFSWHFPVTKILAGNN